MSGKRERTPRAQTLLTWTSLWAACASVLQQGPWTASAAAQPL